MSKRKCIDLKAVSERMIELKKLDENDGWTNCIVDVLEEMYGLETELYPLIPMSVDAFSNPYERLI